MLNQQSQTIEEDYAKERNAVMANEKVCHKSLCVWASVYAWYFQDLVHSHKSHILRVCELEKTRIYCKMK